jgi:hypothetical protein
MNAKIMTAAGQIRSKSEVLDGTGAVDTRVVWVWVIEHRFLFDAGL